MPRVTKGLEAYQGVTGLVDDNPAYAFTLQRAIEIAVDGAFIDFRNKSPWQVGRRARLARRSATPTIRLTSAPVLPKLASARGRKAISAPGP